jgi:hypothetical protein
MLILCPFQTSDALASSSRCRLWKRVAGPRECATDSRFGGGLSAVTVGTQPFAHRDSRWYPVCLCLQDQPRSPSRTVKLCSSLQVGFLSL